MRKVYEAVEDNGEGALTDWEYFKTQEAQIDRKLHMLQQVEVNSKTGKAECPQDVLAGPGVYNQKFIYKLQTRGNVALRPMVCLGPVTRDAEWTVLTRAIEKQWKLIPKDAADRAELRRQEIVAKRRDRFLILDVP
jgi:hypothetical protein